MKKRTCFLLLIFAGILFLGAASAAGGDAGDPLISLSFLKSTFSSDIDRSVDGALEQSDQTLLNDANTQWNKILAVAEANVGSEHTAVFQENRLKQNDILSGPTGLQVIVLAGSVKTEFSSGSVVDVTAGAEISSGSTLSLNHRYLVAENTTALFTAASKTAVVDYCGTYFLSLSASADYNAMASALKTLTLFRGSDTGFGQGFDLERAPTRTEALVMLIRLLGEEAEALACTASHPFRDVDPWAAPYVAYAYQKGYSNGMSADMFGSSVSASVQMYTEFILRALGYSSTAQADISDALTRAVSCGVITGNERAALESGAFVRADVVYLSYYALEAVLSGEPFTLYEKLISDGVFTSSDYRRATALVTTQRI